MIRDIMEALALLEQAPPAVLDNGWEALGRCRKHPDPDLWFDPVDESSPRYDHLSGRALMRARVRDRDRAREMCRACPVRRECLGYALERSGRNEDGDFGIWGGLDKRDRTRLKDRLTAAKDAAA